MMIGQCFACLLTFILAKSHVFRTTVVPYLTRTLTLTCYVDWVAADRSEEQID